MTACQWGAGCLDASCRRACARPPRRGRLGLRVPSRKCRFFVLSSGKSPATRNDVETTVFQLNLKVWFPALFVLALPHFHRFGVALDVAVLGVELQFAVHFPSDVRELEHSNGNVAF